MFRKLLHLYNDGHNPFPNMKGRGFGPYINPSHPDREEIGYFADDTMTQEEANAKNQGLEYTISEIPSVKQQREEYEAIYPERYTPTVQSKEDYENEQKLNKYFKDLDEKNDALNLEEIKNKYDYEDEMDTLNKEISYNQSQEVKMLKGDTLDSLKKANDLLEKEEKAEKRKIVINNLQKKKHIDILIVKAEEDSDKFYSAMQKKGSKYKQLVQEYSGIFLDNINEYDEDDLTDKILLSEVMKFSKITNGKLNDVIPALIHYNNLFVISDKVEKETREYLKFVNDKLLRLAYKDEFKVVEKIDKENKITEERLKEIAEQKKKLGFRIVYIESGREENKPLKLKYHELKQQEKAREEKVISEIEKIKKLKESNPEQAKADAIELRDELVKKVEKLKQSKPIKKSQEEKQIELTKADVVGRLTHVSDSISPYGKDLETYLASPNGSIILKYITNDNSTVYDNEYNKNIPDRMVTLDSGKTESLRKAVTLDLYSDKHVFEIKNYKQYSFTDDIIPLQETKLEGTYYFKPLYLKNGNLYNIELTYTDETGEHKKYILPENKEGRELVLIYRLKDGLYQYKPLIGNDVTLQHTTNKTKDGNSLYVFKNAVYDTCKDHHGKPSFNIKPFLRKIKI